MIKMNLQLFGGRGSGSGKAISENLAKKLAFTDYANRNQISNKDIEDIYGEYQYHATTSKAVFQIYEQGLIPNRGHAGREVYILLLLNKVLLIGQNIQVQVENFQWELKHLHFIKIINGMI